jgi:Phage minor structural protein GP20
MKTIWNYSCAQSEKQALHSGRNRTKRNVERIYMKLEEVLSKELYEQVKAAIDAVNVKEQDKLKHVRFTDLSEGEYVSKEKYSSLETDKGSVAAQLQEAQDLIAELKKGTKTDEGLQGKIGTYETTITALTTENEKLKTEGALKLALLDAGAKAEDIDYLIFRAKEKGEIKLTDEGKLKSQDELIAGLKTQCAAQFPSAGGKKIEEHRLPGTDNQNTEIAPKNLAEALKQKYETSTE